MSVAFYLYKIILKIVKPNMITKTSRNRLPNGSRLLIYIIKILDENVFHFYAYVEPCFMGLVKNDDTSRFGNVIIPCQID